MQVKKVPAHVWETNKTWLAGKTTHPHHVEVPNRVIPAHVKGDHVSTGCRPGFRTYGWRTAAEAATFREQHGSK